ncbi:hypothetical protein [Psychrobacter sp. JCM 18903]|nr:hypothetical protein [Psychrobacter sp. JCM 18903]
MSALKSVCAHAAWLAPSSITDVDRQDEHSDFNDKDGATYSIE